MHLANPSTVRTEGGSTGFRVTGGLDPPAENSKNQRRSSERRRRSLMLNMPRL
jgi:hypothetical protein